MGGGFFKRHKLFFLILILAFLLRVFLTPFGTLETPDMNNFRAWSAHIAENGPSKFYDTIWADYTPGYLYVLWLLGIIQSALHLENKLLIFVLFKFPAILADILTGVLIFFAVYKFNKKFALTAASLYWFNPAIFVNSAMWGQVDGITALCALAAVFFAERSPALSVLALSFGAITKPPAGFVAPIVGILWIKKFGWKNALSYTVIIAALFVFGFWPFAGDKSLLPFVFERLGVMAGVYKYTSENAFNFWALILGLWKTDAGWPKILGIFLTVIIGLVALWYWWREERKNSEIAYPMRYLAAAVILLGSFFFLTRMHERHLLPGLAPLTISAAAFPLLWAPYLVLSLIYLVELRFSYVWVTQEFKWIFPDAVVRVLSAINLAMFGVIGWVLLKPAVFYYRAAAPWLGQGRFFSPLHAQGRKIESQTAAAWIKSKLSLIQPHESHFFQKHWLKFLIVILLFAFLTRMYGIAGPPEYYFDEIYHSFTAREYLHGNPDAWVWYSKPPEGRAFDWVQPPTAKLLMAASMWLVGENPVGWRLPGVLLGVGAVLFVYLIGMALFRNKTVSLLAAALFALDGLPLTMSRIGTNDSTFLFFTLGTIYFFICARYFVSSIFFGLAMSTKLSFIWIVPVCLVLFFVLRRRNTQAAAPGQSPGDFSLPAFARGEKNQSKTAAARWKWSLLWFIVIPPAIYLLSFAPFFVVGHTWSELIELHKQMFWYHSHLQATHPFSSPWWSWPFMLKPMWLFTQSYDGLVSNIYAQGNPAVFWLGFVAMLALLAIAVITKRRELWAVLIAYCGLFIPWSLSPRIMFLYHYLPSVPFLCLALAWVLASNRYWKKTAIVFLILAIVMFIWLYPHWIGIPVSESFNQLYYKWLPS